MQAQVGNAHVHCGTGWQCNGQTAVGPTGTGGCQDIQPPSSQYSCSQQVGPHNIKGQHIYLTNLYTLHIVWTGSNGDSQPGLVQHVVQHRGVPCLCAFPWISKKSPVLIAENV